MNWGFEWDLIAYVRGLGFESKDTKNPPPAVPMTPLSNPVIVIIAKYRSILPLARG